MAKKPNLKSKTVRATIVKPYTKKDKTKVSRHIRITKP